MDPSSEEAKVLTREIMAVARDIGLWAKDTKRLVDAEFGEGVMGGLAAYRYDSKRAGLVHTTREARGLFYPAEVRALEAQLKSGEWAVTVAEIVADAKSLQNPGSLVKRLHNLSVGNAIDHLISEMATFDLDKEGRPLERRQPYGGVTGGGRGDELAPGIVQMAKVFVAKKRKLKAG